MDFCQASWQDFKQCGHRFRPMQIYYFYTHQQAQSIFMSRELLEEYPLQFTWIDCVRQDVVNHAEQWQNLIQQQTQICLNEFHLKDILNIEHPCAFDTVENYNLIIFRKLITPDDQINTKDLNAEYDEHSFGLATTPVSFIVTPKVLVSVREQGNRSIENYIQRFETILPRNPAEQNKPRKLPNAPVDLVLRLLNIMIDGYLDLRNPLTQRVEYWQQELLQGSRRFKQWAQLFQDNMAFQQIENLCEEQIEMLQELRDETVDNYPHLIADQTHNFQDILLVRLNDLMSHVERIQKHTLRLRAAIQSAIDLHFSAIANQTNENMRILAIITAIFAPLTLLTGIYGMNFQYMPGLKSPDGFWLMLIVMLISTLILLYYFHCRNLVGRGEQGVIDLLAQKRQQRHVNLLWFFPEPLHGTSKQTSKKHQE